MQAIKWFGESWGAPVNTGTERVGTPLDQECLRCTKPFELGDEGFVIPYTSRIAPSEVYYHRACFYEEIGYEEIGIGPV